MKQLLKEAILYGAASGLGLVFDVCLLWLLVEHFNQHYLVAAAVAFIGGTLVVYALSVTLIFQHRRVTNRRVEFSSFAAIGVVGLLVNLIVLRFAVETLSAHYLVGKMVSVVFTFSLNFGLRRCLLFSRRDNVRALPTRGPFD